MKWHFLFSSITQVGVYGYRLNQLSKVHQRSKLVPKVKVKVKGLAIKNPLPGTQKPKTYTQWSDGRSSQATSQQPSPKVGDVAILVLHVK
jgi:hypothetical protein